MKETYIRSPLSWPGNKSKLIKQYARLGVFDCDVVEPFSGLAMVGVNLARSIHVNDIDRLLIAGLRFLYETPTGAILERLRAVIRAYGFTDASTYGRAYYAGKGCTRFNLARLNRDPFNALREDINRGNIIFSLRQAALVLMMYSFNNRLRYNLKGEVNITVGRVDLCPPRAKKLIAYAGALQSKEVIFSTLPYQQVPTKDRLAFFDPPYLLAGVNYQGWGPGHLEGLLAHIDALEGPWALAECLEHKGRTNQVLTAWANGHTVVPLRRNYNYAGHVTTSREVLILP